MQVSKFQRQKLGSSGSREIHPDGLSGMGLPESALEVVEAGLGVSENGGFFGEVQSALRIIVVLGTGTDNVCV